MSVPNTNCYHLSKIYIIVVISIIFCFSANFTHVEIIGKVEKWGSFNKLQASVISIIARLYYKRRLNQILVKEELG